MLDSCQEYQISHQREVTWEQGPIRALASIILGKKREPTQDAKPLLGDYDIPDDDYSNGGHRGMDDITGGNKLLPNVNVKVEYITTDSTQRGHFIDHYDDNIETMSYTHNAGNTYLSGERMEHYNGTVGENHYHINRRRKCPTGSEFNMYVYFYADYPCCVYFFQNGCDVQHMPSEMGRVRLRDDTSLSDGHKPQHTMPVNRALSDGHQSGEHVIGGDTRPTYIWPKVEYSAFDGKCFTHSINQIGCDYDTFRLRVNSKTGSKDHPYEFDEYHSHTPGSLMLRCYQWTYETWGASHNNGHKLIASVHIYANHRRKAHYKMISNIPQCVTSIRGQVRSRGGEPLIGDFLFINTVLVISYLNGVRHKVGHATVGYDLPTHMGIKFEYIIQDVKRITLGYNQLLYCPISRTVRVNAENATRGLHYITDDNHYQMLAWQIPTYYQWHNSSNSNNRNVCHTLNVSDYSRRRHMIIKFYRSYCNFQITCFVRVAAWRNSQVRYHDAELSDGDHNLRTSQICALYTSGGHQREGSINGSSTESLCYYIKVEYISLSERNGILYKIPTHESPVNRVMVAPTRCANNTEQSIDNIIIGRVPTNRKRLYTYLIFQHSRKQQFDRINSCGTAKAPRPNTSELDYYILIRGAEDNILQCIECRCTDHGYTVSVRDYAYTTILRCILYIIPQIPNGPEPYLYPGYESQPKRIHEHSGKYYASHMPKTTDTSPCVEWQRAAMATLGVPKRPLYQMSDFIHNTKLMRDSVKYRSTIQNDWMIRDYVTVTDMTFNSSELYINEQLCSCDYDRNEGFNGYTINSKCSLYSSEYRGRLRVGQSILFRLLYEISTTSLRASKGSSEHIVVYIIPRGMYSLKRNFAHPYPPRYYRLRPTYMRLLYNPISGLYLSDVLTYMTIFGNSEFKVKPKMRSFQPARVICIKSEIDLKAGFCSPTVIFMSRHNSRCCSYQYVRENGVSDRKGPPKQRHHG